MIYDDLILPEFAEKTYFFSNFVVTIDGKSYVKNYPGYWPIGSRSDYQTLIQLRKLSDCLIHGKNTAIGFKAMDSLTKMAQPPAKLKDFLYIVVSNEPGNNLIPFMQEKIGIKTLLVTSNNAKLSWDIQNNIEVVRFGQDSVDLFELSNYLFKNGYKKVLVEGGPTLLGGFLKDNLLDELFLTISPKIFGTIPGSSIGLVENFAFNPENAPNCTLISTNQHQNELFLRYKINY